MQKLTGLSFVVKVFVFETRRKRVSKIWTFSGEENGKRRKRRATEPDSLPIVQQLDGLAYKNWTMHFRKNR